MDDDGFRFYILGITETDQERMMDWFDQGTLSAELKYNLRYHILQNVFDSYTEWVDLVIRDQYPWVLGHYRLALQRAVVSYTPDSTIDLDGEDHELLMILKQGIRECKSELWAAREIAQLYPRDIE